MANEDLIGQLNGLREQYAGRQRAATGLQGALKGVLAAHSKAQKSLREVEAQAVGLDVGATQQALADGRLREGAIDPLLPDLRREVKSLTLLTGALKEAATALGTEPVDVVRLDKARTVLQNYRQADVAALLPDLTGELELAQRNLGDEFGGRLRAALAEVGIAIGGRAPKFEIGRFELDANFAKRASVLRYGKDTVVAHLPVTVEATLRAYSSAAKAITGRNTDGAAWIAQFAEAYETARRKRAVSGPRVNIVDCYLELVLLRQSRAFAAAPSKATFADYTRAQFIYDFYEFADRQRLAVAGRRVSAHSATKSQTDNPAKSMWIVEGDSPYDGRYIADVELGKD
ncbi:MAG: hypothetical protein M3Z04_06135 [Chloroflexota bacterium]|nr:hypothetical protein [Chloroflexota bacterium]